MCNCPFPWSATRRPPFENRCPTREIAADGFASRTLCTGTNGTTCGFAARHEDVFHISRETGVYRSGLGVRPAIIGDVPIALHHCVGPEVHCLPPCSGARLEELTSGDRLDDNGLLAFLVLLLIAGNETTRNAISGGLLALRRSLSSARS